MIRRRFFFLLGNNFSGKLAVQLLLESDALAHKHYRSLIKMSCCGVCGDSGVGSTSKARKEHAADAHSYPNCDTCGRIIRNLKMFEAHARTPHRKKKCLLHTCDELVIVGKELEHAQNAHGFPDCSCGKTIACNVANFVQHVNSHFFSGAAKAQRRTRRRPLLQLRKHVQTTPAAAAAAVDPRDDATTTTIPAATEGDPLRLLDAVYYDDDDNDESMCND